MYDDEVILPWFRHLASGLPSHALVDVHCHVGFNDPDGFTFSTDQLIGTLAAAGARGVIMPMHEPGGYGDANDVVLAAAADSPERLIPFCRVDPNHAGLAEATRCIEAGARGIKLHPRAEQFEVGAPEVEPLFALAHDRRLPVLIHSGRGIPALARDAVGLAAAYPDARIILAHAAISDLNWIWREARRYPNLFFDTAWWHPSDLAALFALVPPGQLLYGSDLPYFTPFLSVTMAARHGLQVGLTAEQLTYVLGGQAERLFAGEDPADLGDAPGPGRLGQSILLERITSALVLAVGRMLIGRTGYEPLSLARLACDIGDPAAPEAEVCRNVLALLARQEQFAREHPGDGPPLAAGIRSVMLAASVSRTPDVQLPAILELASAEDMRRASQAGHRFLAAAGLPPALADTVGDMRRSSAMDHLIVDPGT